MRRVLLALGVCAGLALGFVLGLRAPTNDLQPQAVDVELRLDHRLEAPKNLMHGWAGVEPWGIWMKGSEAGVIFALDGPAKDNLILLIEGRKRESNRPSTLRLQFNNTEIGRWQLPQEARSLRRQFVIPTDVLNSSSEARLSFESIDHSDANFGVERLWLHDVSRSSGFMGVLDLCSSDQLSGWAVADDAPLNVMITSRDRPVPGTLTNVERPDLPKHGLPLEAGFVFRPANPLPKGTKIDVRFPDGKFLEHSPCLL